MWKIIKDKTQYNAAMDRLIELAELDLEENTPESDEFELLSLLIQHYEEKKYPTVKTDPVRAIKFVMEQNSLTNKDMIPYFGAASRVSEVLSYKRKLTLNMMRKLNKGLGIPLELLIDDYEVQPTVLEQHYDFVVNTIKTKINHIFTPSNEQLDSNIHYQNSEIGPRLTSLVIS